MPEPGWVLCSCCQTKEVLAFNFMFGKYPKGFIVKRPRCHKCKHHGEPCATEREKESS